MVKIFNRGDVVALSPHSLFAVEDYQLEGSGKVVGSYLNSVDVRWYEVRYMNEWGEAYNVYRATDLVPI